MTTKAPDLRDRARPAPHMKIRGEAIGIEAYAGVSLMAGTTTRSLTMNQLISRIANGQIISRKVGAWGISSGMPVHTSCAAAVKESRSCFPRANQMSCTLAERSSRRRFAEDRAAWRNS